MEEAWQARSLSTMVRRKLQWRSQGPQMGSNFGLKEAPERKDLNLWSCIHTYHSYHLKIYIFSPASWDMAYTVVALYWLSDPERYDSSHMYSVYNASFVESKSLLSLYLGTLNSCNEISTLMLIVCFVALIISGPLWFCSTHSLSRQRQELLKTHIYIYAGWKVLNCTSFLMVMTWRKMTTNWLRRSWTPFSVATWWQKLYFTPRQRLQDSLRYISPYRPCSDLRYLE